MYSQGLKFCSWESWYFLKSQDTHDIQLADDMNSHVVIWLSIYCPALYKDIYLKNICWWLNVIMERKPSADVQVEALLCHYSDSGSDRNTTWNIAEWRILPCIKNPNIYPSWEFANTHSEFTIFRSWLRSAWGSHIHRLSYGTCGRHVWFPNVCITQIQWLFFLGGGRALLRIRVKYSLHRMSHCSVAAWCGCTHPQPCT